MSIATKRHILDLHQSICKRLHTYKMAKTESSVEQVRDLTLAYVQKLSTKELIELFKTISSQFTARLQDCKDIEELKALQTYLHLINSEIKLRDTPQDPAKP